MTTDITELAHLRAELSNSAIGSKDHLRKLALSLVEALEKAQTGEKQWREVVDAFCTDDADWHNLTTSNNELIALLSQALCKQADRIAELESEVKFPGVMRCNTCGFSRSHVIVTPVGMRAGESVPEHCPNGCGPLWHDTYRRQYNELYDAYKELEFRSVKLPLGSLPKTEGFWSAIYDMAYQTNRKPHENWNVSLAFSETKEIVEWLNEIMPFRPATGIKWEDE